MFWLFLLVYFVVPITGNYHIRHLRNHENRIRRSSALAWPVKRVADIPGDILLGGLHMIHERQDQLICGPVMPQGGLQAAEVMLFTIDKVNQLGIMPRGVTLGTQILDDCDKDTYGLQQAVDFIKGNSFLTHRAKVLKNMETLLFHKCLVLLIANFEDCLFIVTLWAQLSFCTQNTIHSK